MATRSAALCEPLVAPRAVVQDMRLFSGNANVELARETADLLHVELGNITVSRFADGPLLLHRPRDDAAVTLPRAGALQGK
jgi:hypothetical protein